MQIDWTDRFHSKISPEPMSGCWLWTASCDVGGYGYFWFNGKGQKAHRVAYEIYKDKIPNGLELDHLCRIRSCVNPEHLEAISHCENVLRGEGGINNIIKTHCPKGHPYAGNNLYIWPRGARGCRRCHREQMAARRGMLTK